MSNFRRSGVAIFVFDQNRNAAIGWVKWIVLDAQKLVGVTAHLGYLVRAHAMLLKESARGVGAIGRKFPVTIIGVG